MKVLALILAIAPTMAQPQTLAEILSTAPEISYEDWRDMTAGKTVVYQIFGKTFGFERYQNGNNVTIQLDDGSCIDGTWFMQETAFCFDWEGGPLNCFHHKRVGDTIYIVGLDNGKESADIQIVSRIDNTPISCGPALLSALELGPLP